MKILIWGDSYACCDGVRDINSWWPVQLLRRLTQSTAQPTVHARCKAGASNSRDEWLSRVTLGQHEVTIIAQTGKRSDELWTAVDLENATQPLINYNWVIIGVGANNQFQYGAEDTSGYEEDLVKLVKLASIATGARPNRVIMYSIPYWHLTPNGASEETSKYRQDKYKVEDNSSNQVQIDAYNQIARSVARKRGISFVDITPISAQIGTQAKMVTEDKLHYSPQAFDALFLQPLLTVIQPIHEIENQIRHDQQVASVRISIREDHPIEAEEKSSLTSGCISFFSRCMKGLAACCTYEDEGQSLDGYNMKRRWSR